MRTPPLPRSQALAFKGLSITGLVWSTSINGRASIIGAGVLTALVASTVTIQVTFGGLTAQTAVTAVPRFAGTAIYVSTSGLDTNAGTEFSPVRTIQRGVTLANQANTAGNDALVSIGAGVYREAVTIGSLSTTRTLTLEGAGASTVLTGTDDWSTGWTLQGDDLHVHSWPYRWGTKPVPRGWDSYWNWDGNGYKRDILRRSEMVYVNGQPLRGVLTPAELSTAGTFYVDETIGRLHLRLPSGVAMAGSLVEVGIRVSPLLVDGRRHVTLRNFAVMRNRGAVQDAAVQLSNAQNVVVDGLQVRWTAYTGLATASISELHISSSIFSDNGVYGIGGYRNLTVLMDASEVARNNWRGWPAEHKGFDSVHKWVESRDVTLRRSRFIDNWGHGVWFDGDNQRVVVEDIVSSGNHLHGAYFELNTGPITLQKSKICANGQGGVGNARSNDLRILSNQIFGNQYWQIFSTGSATVLPMTDWQTGRTSVVSTSDWTISGNTVVGGASAGPLPNECYPGPCGWVFWAPEADQFGYIQRTLTADENRWYHASTTKSFAVPSVLGTAVDGATFRALMSEVKPNEIHSTWGNPGALACTP